MDHERVTLPPLIAWGVAGLALEERGPSGDLHLVTPFPNGALVAVVDGLGHGAEAAAAARLAIATLESSAGEPVIPLAQRCHGALRGTRGVVMSLASFNGREGTVNWLGVGNVAGVLVRAEANARPAREWVLLRGGVVGYTLPPLRASVLPVAVGDTLIFVTDGIRDGFAEGLPVHDPPQHLADRILTQSGKGTDDALVLVVRYMGADHG